MGKKAENPQETVGGGERDPELDALLSSYTPGTDTQDSGSKKVTPNRLAVQSEEEQLSEEAQQALKQATAQEGGEEDEVEEDELEESEDEEEEQEAEEEEDEESESTGVSREQYEALQAQLEAILDQFNSANGTNLRPNDVQQQPAQQQSTQSAASDEQPAPTLIDEQAFEKLQRSPEEANEVLTGIFTKMLSSVYQQIPQVANNVVQGTLSTREAAIKFASDNPDLANPASMKFVGFLANQMRSENPQLANNPAELFSKAGEEARRRLKKAAPAKKGGKKTAKKSGLVKNRPGTRKSSSSSRTSEQKEMQSLLTRRAVR